MPPESELQWSRGEAAWRPFGGMGIPSPKFSYHTEVEEDFLHEISGRILTSNDDDENWEEAGALQASLVQFNEAMKRRLDTAELETAFRGKSRNIGSVYLT